MIATKHGTYADGIVQSRVRILTFHTLYRTSKITSKKETLRTKCLPHFQVAQIVFRRAFNGLISVILRFDGMVQ